MVKLYKVKITADNKEQATNNLKRNFFKGTKRKIVNSKRLKKKGSFDNGAKLLYNLYEFTYKE